MKPELPPHREIRITRGDKTTRRFSGRSVTPETAIAKECSDYRIDEEKENHDRIVWEGDQALALLRPFLTGELVVYWLDEGKMCGDFTPFDDRGEFREFFVTFQDPPGARKAGRGLTLDRVVADEVASFISSRDAAIEDGSNAELFAERFADVVVWEREKVVALIRFAGGEPVVERFDREGGGR